MYWDEVRRDMHVELVVDADGRHPEGIEGIDIEPEEILMYDEKTTLKRGDLVDEKVGKRICDEDYETAITKVGLSLLEITTRSHFTLSI